MKPKNSVLSFIFTVIQPFQVWITALFLINGIWSIVFCLRPYLLKLLFDKIPTIIPENVVQELMGPAILYIMLSLFMDSMTRVSDYIWIKLNSPLKRHIGIIVMEKMLKHSHALFQNYFAGGLASRIKDSMSGIPDLIRLCANTFFSYFLALLIAIFTVWTVNYTFAIALFIWAFFFLGASLVLSKRAHSLSHQASEVRSSVVGNIVDILSNIINVRLFSTRLFELQRLKKILDTWVIADQKRDWYFLWVGAFLGISFIVYQSVCMIWLILGLKNSQITSGDFVLIITLNISIVNLLRLLAEEMGKFADFLGNITQGLRIALMPIDIKDSPDAKELTVSAGQIAFDHVYFSYNDSATLFQNTTIVIEHGQKVGLVGYSGSGKSTFVNLILRLYDVNAGHILIDDHDIRTITQDSLHTAIGMIPQDPILFNRTLMENIRYGSIYATDAQVIEAARASHAHEFIIELPLGYNSLVGERGIKLSGGQRQRIALARVILKNAPLLVLDEATSHLDSITEKAIQEFLIKFIQNKTTIVIAHRLSTLLHMDRILVFDKGTIVEDGTHQELLIKKGLYTTLWNTQVGGFLPDKEG